MPIQVSPSVVVVEKDITNIVPALASTAGAFAGTFQWGPVEQIRTIDSEKTLLSTYGSPNNDTAISFFTAANFLGYGNRLNVSRVVGTAARNAVVSGTALLIKNSDVYDTSYENGQAAVGGFAAKYPGAMGNSLRVVMADKNIYNGQYVKAVNVLTGGAGYVSAPLVTINGDGTGATAVATLGSGATAGQVVSITVTNTGTGYTSISSIGFSGGTPSVVATASGVLGSVSGWDFKSLFSSAPGTSNSVAAVGGSNDELHALVVDQDGLFSGVPGTVLETFPFVSKASNAMSDSGVSTYYKKVINSASQYVYWMDHPITTNNNIGSAAAGVAFDNLAGLIDNTLIGGVSDDVLTDAAAQAGYALFANDQAVDISLIPLGGASSVTATYVINNIAEARKDCVAFVSPTLAAVLNNVGAEATTIVSQRNTLPSSSYAVMDSGWKYQYDRYNDVYRWIPLNGDIAGLCARTDQTNDPWYSPAGLNRGQIKNVVKLAYNPKLTDRDTLYNVGVNPVVTMPGQGTVLFGDKTLLSKPSAFDRINVRRLFITLEKSIATASKYILFEFNDPFTRAQFKSLVEPFLRDVKGRRGISDFLVVCDETNNTDAVIDGNRFVGEIYIKANRSINFIELRFVNTPTGVSFSEIVGV